MLKALRGMKDAFVDGVVRGWNENEQGGMRGMLVDMIRDGLEDGSLGVVVVDGPAHASESLREFYAGAGLSGLYLQENVLSGMAAFSGACIYTLSNDDSLDVKQLVMFDRTFLKMLAPHNRRQVIAHEFGHFIDSRVRGVDALHEDVYEAEVQAWKHTETILGGKVYEAGREFALNSYRTDGEAEIVPIQLEEVRDLYEATAHIMVTYMEHLNEIAPEEFAEDIAEYVESTLEHVPAIMQGCLGL